MTVNDTIRYPTLPTPAAILELSKPITWFPPVWAFGCGLVSSGIALSSNNLAIALMGLVLAGPLVCAMSQAANDWCDRHVDAVNEPQRPIPSGRVPGRWGLWLALLWSVVSLCVGALLGVWAFGATLLAVLAAWAYSAEPIRLKRSGWLGAATCGLCYEGLPWFTGAAVMLGGLPDTRIIVIALLYSVGAIGIMILNDFKSVEGDRDMGVRSVPVSLGFVGASRAACAIMAVPQLCVIVCLLTWGKPIHAAVISLLLLAQCALMPRFLNDPKGMAPSYNASGTLLYVIGMMFVATALGAMELGSMEFAT